jgi:hypothetical protein
MEAFKKCEKVLALLKKHTHSKEFLYPVAIPGYSNVIKEPMDLMTIEKKLRTGMYTSSRMFANDIRKIWSNAWTYNEPGSTVYIATTNISDYFEGLMKEVEDVQFAPANNEQIQQLKKQVNKANEALKKITGGGLQRTNSTGSRKPPERPMTSKERSVLAQNIQKLSKDKPLEILSILRTVLDLPISKSEVEFDLEKLSARKCRELDQAVRKELISNDKSKLKKKKIEQQNEIKAAPVTPQAQITQVSTKEEDKKDESKVICKHIGSESESSFEDDDHIEAKVLPENSTPNGNQTGTYTYQNKVYFKN